MERAPYTHQTHMRAPALIHWSKAGRRSKREGEGRKIQPLSPSPSIPTLFFLLLLLLLLFDLFRPWGKGRGTSRICHALKTRADSSCETRSHTATREPTAHFKAHSENRGAFQRMMMKKKKTLFHILDTIRSAASWTVARPSAPSSSRVTSNFSSRAIMISTVSRESAPRSANLASGPT